MKEKQTKLGGVIVTKKLKEPIPDGCIHIYPGRKVAIGLARSFFDEIKELGVDRWKRTKEQKYDHPDLPTIVSVVDDTLNISIYAEEIGIPTGKIHNFLVSGIEKHTEDVLRERFETTTRVKVTRMMRIPERYSRVVHLSFNLNEAEIVGNVQKDVRDFFQ